MALDLDELYEIIGSLKYFQIRVIFILGWCVFWTSVHPLVSTFTAGDPGWKCITNSTKCNYNGTFFVGNEIYTKRCDKDLNMVRGEDWDFNDEYTSIITEWNLVCGDSILASFSSSVYFAGFLVGVSGFGFISDKFGRKIATYTSCIGASLFGTVSAFSPNLAFFTACKFFIGLTAGGSGLVMFVLASELCGVRHRGTVSTSIWYFWTLANVVLAGFAYGVRQWDYLSLTVSVPGFSIVLLWWFIPESPRWYLVKGRIDKAEKVMREIARINKTEYPPDNIKPLHTEGRNIKTGNVLDLFKNSTSIKRTLIQWISWFINSMVYYGVSLSSGNLGGSLYVNFFLISLMELPGTWLTIWTTNKFGRKIPVVVGLIVAALASLAAAAFPYEEDNTGFMVGRIIFALVAKLSIVISFDAIYIFSAELIPTTIRNVGMGTCSAAARVGSFSASYVIWLQNVHSMLPFGIMAICGFLAGVLCLLLPETRNLPTQEMVGPGESQIAPAGQEEEEKQPYGNNIAMS